MNITSSKSSQNSLGNLASTSGFGVLAAAVSLAAISTTSISAEDAPSRVNALLNFEFSDKYLTPRGMIVHQNGLTFQQLALGFFNVYKGESFITDFTLVGGVWNDFSSGPVLENAPGANPKSPKTSWIEIDPIAGISVGLGKKFTLSMTYTAFNMQILDIPFSQHLETKLAFDDSEYLKDFALHPYFLYWQELVNKATAAQVPYNVFAKTSGPGSSYYFELGVAPSYTFKDIGLKLEAPTRVLLPDKNFYGEFYGSSSVVGLWETGLKATIPLKFIPPGYGHWNAHAGFKYMSFEDQNLAGMQQFNAPGKATKDCFQLFAGIGIFF